MTLPIVPYADAGPLYGLVWPILISVAVTPGVSAAIAGAGARASTAISALSTVLSMMSSCRAPGGSAGSGPILLRGHGQARAAVPRRPRRAQARRPASAIPDAVEDTVANRKIAEIAPGAAFGMGRGPFGASGTEAAPT